MSKPAERQIETDECHFSGDKFKSAKQRKWCDFCGLNTDQKYLRYRNFEEKDEEGCYNRGEICLLCLKKFHIREMVLRAQETYKMVDRDIKSKQKQIEDEVPKQERQENQEVKQTLDELRN